MIVCGGGTGGHIYPALAVLNRLPEAEVLWVGTAGQMEERLVPEAGYRLVTIQGGPVVGVPLGTRLKNLAKLLFSVGRSYRMMKAFRPDVLFFTGGYVNAPVALVGRWLKVPAFIYLPDVEPGTTIRKLIGLVDKIGVTSPDSSEYIPVEKMVVTGYPVRATVREAMRLSKAEALAQFNLTEERPTLFVFGGSRGAQSINRALMAILPELLTFAQVIHVSGTLTWDEVTENAAKMPASIRPYYRPYPYLDKRMGAGFRSADLVLARGGASMLGESPAFGVPAILVPYPHAWRYQKVNADYLASRGAAVRMDDEQMGEALLPTLRDLLGDKVKLAKMSAAASGLDQPHASQNLANLLKELAKKTHD